MSQSHLLTSSGSGPVPAAVIQELSFCKTTARDLASWLRDLPKANIGEYSRQLYMALTELSNLKAAPELRMQLLEQLRPEVARIIRQLEKNHLLNSVILDGRANHIANLCQSLQHHLNSGYKQVAADLQTKKSGLLVLAIQRTLQGLFLSLARSYLAYRIVPQGLWFEAHQMYRLASHHRLLTQKVKDPLLESIEEQSLEEAYHCILLLGCSRANQMRQGDIKALVDALPGWAQLANLQGVNDAGSVFAISLTTDTPPRYRALLNLEGRDNVIGMATLALTEALMQTLKLESGSNLQVHQLAPKAPIGLLQQLVSAWGNIAKRGFPRTAANMQLELCIGMSAVHYHLAGQKSFEESMLQEQPGSKLQLVPEEPEPTPDVWSMAADVLQGTDDELNVIGYGESLPSSATDNNLRDFSALYPILEATVVNQSPGGYCLEWKQEAPSNLQTGDILALRKDPQQDWSIATIRWLRQNQEAGAQIGVELLAHKANPCGAQLLRSGKAASDYLRALCIPEISAISRPAQLITAKIPFREGNTVTLNIEGEQNKVILGRLVKQTASCSQFEYEDVTIKKPEPPAAQPAAQAAQPHNGNRAKVGDPEDFNSLWGTL